MRRPIWSGAVSFGLVNVPVKLYSAVSTKDVHFHQLHDADGGRIRYKRVCEVDDHEVPYEHIVKGYEIAKGEYVETTTAELAKLHPEDTRRIDIEEFVGLAEIDPIYYAATYYLAPDKGAAKAYALLHRALEEKARVAIGRVVMRTKQYLAAIRPMNKGVLALSTMQYDDEIVPVDEVEGVPGARMKPTAKEIRLATQLVDALAAKFDAGKFHDTYREKVLDLLEKKAAGVRIVKSKGPSAARAPLDLLEALRESLAKGGEAAPKRAHKGVAKARPHKPRSAKKAA